MALIKCKECRAKISTEASVCPRCGVSMPAKVVVKPAKKSSKGSLITLSVLLIIFFIAWQPVREIQKNKEAQDAARITQEAARLTSLTPGQRAAEEKAKSERVKAEASRKIAEAKTKAKRDRQLQIATAGAIALKNAMKDPEAFELKSLMVKPDGAACYEYRAKNGFGAIFPGSAVLSRKGKIFTQDRDGNSFVDVWNKECTTGGGDEIIDTVKRLGIL